MAGQPYIIAREVGGNDDMQTLANARLIAAAPELLDALRIIISQAAVLAHYHRSGTKCDKERLAMAEEDLAVARETIAKATAN